MKSPTMGHSVHNIIHDIASGTLNLKATFVLNYKRVKKTMFMYFPVGK